MEWVVLAVVAIVGWWLWQNHKTKEIVSRHARTLSQQTGIPAKVIRDDMISRRVTPGEWATEHDLHPMTFQPTDSRQAAGAPHLPGSPQPSDDDLRGVWEGVRIDPGAEPPSEDVLYHIGALQEEFAILEAEPAPLLAEMERKNEILAELHDLGARVASGFVRDVVQQHARDHTPFNEPHSQDEYDDWQRQAVARRDEPSGSE